MQIAIEVKRVMRRGAVASAIAGALLVPRLAMAQPSATAVAPEPSDWKSRYDDARALLVSGQYADAARLFDALARDARSEEDRRLASEAARIAEGFAAREAPPPAASEPPARTRDEIAILYASAFLYGAGTGTWFLLQTQPDSAVTATLPFAGLTAAPVIAVALVDGHRPLPRGVPHGITAGLYLGLGEGIWITAYQHARAHRIDRTRDGSSRWEGETVASVLWGGATLGGIAGGALAAGLTTTPGRISFTASSTVWLGLLSGLGASAFLPDGERRGEVAALVGGLGYNVGLFGGMLISGSVSPSVTRVRLVDLSGVAGGLAASGMYLSLAHRDSDRRIGLGVAAGGAAVGLAAGSLLTAGMGREVPAPNGALRTITWQPMITPVLGGAVAGIGGAM